MDTSQLLQEYAGGTQLLADAIQHVPPDMFDEKPVPGTWSVRQVICHLADAEIVYADRIKRMLIEDNPTLIGWSPDESVNDELCLCRDLSNEVEVIRTVRLQVTAILGAQDIEVWQRTAVHNEDGPMTLETVLERITRHIPHHVNFIEAKIAAMRNS